MGTSLTGKNISTTYLGLLKTTDNAVIGSTAKRLTDGSGTDSPLYLSTSKLGIGVTPTEALTISSGNIQLSNDNKIQFGTSDVYISGTTSTDNIQLGIQGATKLTLHQTTGLTLAQYGSGSITGTVTQRLGVTSAGQVVEIPIGGGAVDGSGTAGKITKWTDSDTIGNSIMTETTGLISVAGDVSSKTSDGAILNLQTSDTTVTTDSVLGSIQFNAPNEASGGDAILKSAEIEAVALSAFSATNNATKLVFKVGDSEVASEVLSISKALNMASFATPVVINSSSSSAFKIASGTTNDFLNVGHSAGSTYLSRIGDAYGTHTFKQWDGTTTRNILTLDASQNATFEGDVGMGKLTATKSGTAGVFNSGTTNVVASFTSTDGTGVIQLADSGGNVEIGAAGNDFVVQPAGGVAQLTVGKFILNFAGNVGIGVTPEAWTVFKPLQIGQASAFVGRTSSNQTDVATNFYYDGAEKRITTGYAQRYTQTSDGKHQFWTAGTDSADSTITFSQKFEIANNGNATFAGDVTANVGTFNSDSGGTGLKIIGRSTANAGALRYYQNNGTTQTARIESNDSIFEINSISNLPIQLKTNNSTAITIDGSQNVGIGTTSPSTKLEISGSGAEELLRLSAQSGFMSFYDGSTRTGYIQSDNSNGFFNIGVEDSNAFRIYMGASERMQLDSSGNLGLGTSTMNTTLNLYSSSNTQIGFQDASTGTGSADGFRIGYNGTYGQLWLFEDADFRIATNNTERMRITSAGNVKIGSSTTGTPALNADDLVIDKGASESGITLISTAAASIRFGDAANTSIGSVEYNHNSNYMRFSTNNAERMRLDSSGDLTMKGGRIIVRESDDGNDAVKITRDADEGYVQLFSSGSQTVELRGNGASYFNGGNVGIGTDAPFGELSIKSASPQIYLETASNGNVQINFNENADQLDVMVNNSSGKIAFGTNSTERMRLDSSGNLLLGTTSQAGNGQLSIGIDDSNGGRIALTNLRTALFDGDSLGRIEFVSNDTTSTGVKAMIIAKTEDVSANTNIQFHTGGTLTERMRIDSSGSLIVGTATVAAANAAADNFVIKGTGASVGLTISQDSNSGTGTIFFGDGASSAAAGFRYNHNTGDMAVSFEDDITFANNGGERIRITSAGALEIQGTATSGANKNAFITNSDTLTTIGSTQSAGTPKDMAFYTGAERMRITSGGDVLVGKTGVTFSTAGTAIFEEGEIDVATDGGISLALNRLSSDGDTARFFRQTSQVGSISVTSSATAYNTSSDYRLKEDLQDFNALEIASKIKMYDFKWKADDSRSYGVMAHELEEVVPQAVSGEKDAEEMQQVDYSKLVPILLKSIQELEARVQELEKEI